MNQHQSDVIARQNKALGEMRALLIRSAVFVHQSFDDCYDSDFGEFTRDTCPRCSLLDELNARYGIDPRHNRGMELPGDAA